MLSKARFVIDEETKSISTMSEVAESPAAAVDKKEKSVKILAPKPRKLVLDFPIAIGDNKTRAEGAYATALGAGGIAVGEGAVYIGKQMYLHKGDVPEEVLQERHYADFINNFKSDEMKLLMKRRREVWNEETYQDVVLWLNRFFGETIFEI